ncbi:MAG: flagellar assembly protein FliW [Desulfovermiculus sp.]
MKTLDTRFGPIQYDPQQTIVFIEGMVGFEHLRHFVRVPMEEDDFLVCLQSVEDGTVAFLLVDPLRYFPSYTFPLSQGNKSRLQTDSVEDLIVLTTITVHPDQSITLNLAAPVVLSPSSNLAMQVVLEDGAYSPREPLPQDS